MTYETILYTVSDQVATITLNRSESRNALTSMMYQELSHAFKTIEHDPQVRAVILTGRGKGFCSGQDLSELQMMAAQGHSIGDLLRQGLNPLVTSIRTLEKPVIGALNGVCAGAGASLALAADIRIMSTEATFVFAAFANIGVVPDGGGTWLLPQLVGTQKALELALLADAQHRVTAQDALALGVTMQVVEPTDLMPTAYALATRLASMATLAVGRTKSAIYGSVNRSFAEALDYEAQLQDAMFLTSDSREGIAAFIEKRPAKFTGA